MIPVTLLLGQMICAILIGEPNVLRTYLSRIHVPAAAIGMIGLAVYYAVAGDYAHTASAGLAALAALGIHIQLPGVPETPASPAAPTSAPPVP